MKRILLSGRLTLAIALTLAIVASLAGCGVARSDMYTAKVYVFNNKTAAVVTIEAHENGELRHRWIIEPGESLRQSTSGEDYRAYASVASSGADLYTNTSVFDFSGARMVFDDANELWFNANAPFTPHNIYNRDNYRVNSLGTNEVEWIYDIDPDVASSAVAIIPEPAK